MSSGALRARETKLQAAHTEAIQEQARELLKQMEEEVCEVDDEDSYFEEEEEEEEEEEDEEEDVEEEDEEHELGKMRQRC
eukprot:symbB.v1.2.019829.t1/scaffold1629.1/size108820/7